MSHPKMDVVWRPPGRESQPTHLTKFRTSLNSLHGLDMKTYEDVHRFSIDKTSEFWAATWDYVGIQCDRRFDRVLSDPKGQAASLPRWFEGARFSVAENVLFPIHPDVEESRRQSKYDWPRNEETALEEVDEAVRDGRDGSRKTTWGTLRQNAFHLTWALRRNGIGVGDVVACISANNGFAVTLGIAVNAVGAIFSLCATDDGVLSLQRKLSQVAPKVIFAQDRVVWKGREHNVAAKAATIVKEWDDGLSDPPRLITFSGRSDSATMSANEVHTTMADFVCSGEAAPPYSRSNFDFCRQGAQSPLQIFFSSGTTGEPKCIVHSQCVALNLKKEWLLQSNSSPRDSFLQVTTCGWVMWLFNYASLLVGGTALLYDGSPLHPDPMHLVSLVDELGANGLGVSPRFLSELQAHRSSHVSQTPSFARLRHVTSSGAPLSPGNVEFFYSFFPRDVRIATLSGGTDVAGTFCGPSADLEVHGSFMQCKMLGMDLQIWHHITGKNVENTGAAGELIVVKPFPTQPLCFHGPSSKTAELKEKYMKSYYLRFPGEKVWCQGDFIMRHPVHGGLEILGRSDGVLNPSGVRFGSAEIYTVVEKLVFVEDCIVVGQRRPSIDEDERVLLFVKLRNGYLSLSQIQTIKSAISAAYTPRHVPFAIFQVDEIPVTLNGKKPEVAVKQIVNGATDFEPSSSIANPKSLLQFRKYAELGKSRAPMSSL
ncbi:acetyl-CoA synthetase-like protein [Acaromyces ingoldii]|uniref:Acetyl-CoA synthetase-like protein n=1 Tax=Acaromyces ingoldii TaxID=215250 RepID=A0A316YBU6_9BASI|nr:acetyl-CoA synthetase-like protein [Acaromyces ingoldii]PWN86762.1 acetyl-CoA synthetase-like protein [Acaromyces ingoldii]